MKTGQGLKAVSTENEFQDLINKSLNYGICQYWKAILYLKLSR